MSFSMDWVIIIVSIISLLVIGCLAYFGFILHRRRFPYQFPHEFLRDLAHAYGRPPDPNLIQGI
ncbi:MAG: hypothetical protein FJ006_12000 [Chloroflexi bacterium]|nr:hypothetical protein [Chloroflexota bacterium]